MYIGADPDVVRGDFRTAVRIGDVGDDLEVWLLTGRTTPWQQIWERQRTLTVG